MFIVSKRYFEYDDNYWDSTKSGYPVKSFTLEKEAIKYCQKLEIQEWKTITNWPMYNPEGLTKIFKVNELSEVQDIMDSLKLDIKISSHFTLFINKPLKDSQYEKLINASTLRFYYVASDIKEVKKAYVVMQTSFEYNDYNYNPTEDEAGLPIKIFKNKIKADTFCLQKTKDLYKILESDGELQNYFSDIRDISVESISPPLFKVIEVDIE